MRTTPLELCHRTNIQFTKPFLQVNFYIKAKHAGISGHRNYRQLSNMLIS